MKRNETLWKSIGQPHWVIHTQGIASGIGSTDIFMIFIHPIIDTGKADHRLRVLPFFFTQKPEKCPNVSIKLKLGAKAVKNRISSAYKHILCCTSVIVIFLHVLLLPEPAG